MIWMGRESAEWLDKYNISYKEFTYSLVHMEKGRGRNQICFKPLARPEIGIYFEMNEVVSLVKEIVRLYRESKK